MSYKLYPTVFPCKVSRSTFEYIKGCRLQFIRYYCNSNWWINLLPPDIAGRSFFDSLCLPLCNKL